MKTSRYLLLISIIAGIFVSCTNQPRKNVVATVQQKKVVIADRYEIQYQNHEKLVIDHQNKIVWQGTIPQKFLLWQEAIDYCNNLEYGGYSDWRLPTLKELKSLIVGCSAIENCEFDESCKDNECFTKDCNGCERNMCEGPGENGTYCQAGVWGEIQCGDSVFWSSCSLSNAEYGLYAVMVVSFSGGHLNDAPMFDEDNKDSSMSLVRCVR